MKCLKYISLYFFVSYFIVCHIGYAQQPLNQINISSFIVKNRLPADINSWDNIPGSMILVAQKLSQVQLQNVKLVLQVKQGGNRICGNTAQTATVMDAFAVRNFSAGELVSMLSQCQKLSSNNYSLCAQFFNIDNYPISREFCKEFSVEDMVQTYSLPQNISPSNEKKVDEAFLRMPITFRWTPVLPKPKDPVMYKLRVWQLMQGQTGIQAMKSNEPIVEKEVSNINQAIVANMITGPCKPPYLCDFVWNVKALDKEGKPIGKNEGMSELFSFTMKQKEWEHTKLLLPENKKTLSLSETKLGMFFKWTAFVPAPSNPVVYRLRIWQLKQGQTELQASRNNKPIVTKYIDNTEQITISNFLSNPCTAPFLCSFAWTVQALGSDGNPLDDGKEIFNSFNVE
jgi:hypothetical protein